MTSGASYHVLTTGRAGDLWRRLAFSALIAVAVGCLTHPWWPAAWFMAVVASQFASRWAGEAARRDPEFVPSAAWERRYLLFSGLIGFVFVLIAPYAWFLGGAEGRLLTMVILMGGMLSVTTQAEVSRAFLVVGCAPFLLVLAALPLATMVTEPRADRLAMSFLMVGGFLYGVHVFTAVRRREGLADALRAALSVAEAERTRAEQANAAKSVFLATMSHEIRTPLNGVLGMTQAMAGDRLPRRQRERLNVVRQSGEVLLVLLNDLLDISKIEAARLELDVGALSLEEMAVQGAAAFSPLAAENGVALSVETTPAAAGLWRADALRVRQIFNNLLSNAVKFTHTGRIAVRIDAPDGDVVLRIEDTGPGIASDRLDHLFERFVQADATTTRRYGGSGLGLAISRELARLMGGDITVESVEGQGSTFTVRLPLARFVGEIAPSPAPEAGDPGNLSALRVLVAEDNETNRLVLSTLLDQVGLTPHMTCDGAEALRAWEDSAWDIILMDIQMPVMDGLAAVRRIRNVERETGRVRTPVVALTANAMAHHVAEYGQAGFDAVAAKPIQFDRLLAAMESALDRAGALKAA
jgi:signal transduction histidine kinase/ActR/RegA family two-component response regulator